MSVKDSHTYLGDLDDLEGRKQCYESTVKFNCFFFEIHGYSEIIQMLIYLFFFHLF